MSRIRPRVAAITLGAVITLVSLCIFLSVFKPKPEDGGGHSRFNFETSPEVSAPVLVSLLEVDEARLAGTSVRTGLERLKHWTREGSVRNLDTRTLCFALLACARANKSGEFDPQVRCLEVALRQTQWGWSGGTADAVFAGGFGPLPNFPPDLTSTAMAIESLRSAGVSCDDAAIRGAVGFLLTCQEGGNPLSAVDDGGFSELPNRLAAAAALPRGQLSGSATCSALAALLAAGHTFDDPAVQRGQAWLSRHFTLKENPGLGGGRRRLYWYYCELAKFLRRSNQAEITGGDGASHDWRSELLEVLMAEQRHDGSWQNPQESPWAWESEPVVVTSWALLAISRMCGTDDLSAGTLATAVVRN